MIEVISTTDRPGAACYLLVSERGAFLADTGYAFDAESAARNIAQTLGARPLDGILLTHSHFDHVGGLSTMRGNWPEAKVVAHHVVKDILARPGARRLIRSLSDDAAAKCGKAVPQEDYTENFAVDMPAGGGDVMRVGDASIRVIEMPSHTKCSVSYYFQEDDFLVLSETAGVKLETGEVIPSFVISYEAALTAIAEAEAIAPKQMLVPHFGEISGDDVTQYLKDVRAATQAEAELVLAAHAQGKDLEEILDACTEKFYTGRREGPLFEGFLINARTMIPRLIEESEAKGR